MSNIIRIETPFTKEAARQLKAGDTVSISGIIYAARDAAHKRMAGMLEKGLQLPFDVKDQIIYYVGPMSCQAGEIIGPAGPTTSGRMDAYAPALIGQGLTGMIGKGLRSRGVIDAMVKECAVYFGATGGAGALIAKTVTSEEVIAFPELGPKRSKNLKYATS